MKFIGQKEAKALVLPLKKTGQIRQGNALRLNWLKVCPPVTQAVSEEYDLAGPTGRLALDESGLEERTEPETYICGNPPYAGDKKQTKFQKQDMQFVFSDLSKRWRSFDYICGFIYLASRYITQIDNSASAFVSTNSVSQGMQVAHFWPLVLNNAQIKFAELSFKWSNLAARNAGVICVVIGLQRTGASSRFAIVDGDTERSVEGISPYLIPGKTVYVDAVSAPISDVSEMLLGNFAKDGGYLICNRREAENFDDIAKRYLRPMFGGQEFIKGISRYCLWITDGDLPNARRSPALVERFESVKKNRLASPKKATAAWSEKPWRFVEIRSPNYEEAMVIPIVSSESRQYLPVGFLPRRSIVNYAFGMYDAPLWNMSLIASRLHIVWIATVCGKMKSDFRYSNTLGWNTFPVPKLTEQNKEDLTRTSEDILLAREAHFPATIADLYDPKNMPDDLRAAHDRNDEVLERIYIGRRFKNDTERLEKLFELYTKMTAADKETKTAKRKGS